MSNLPPSDPGPSPEAQAKVQAAGDALLTSAARRYVEALEPGQRNLAMEWMLEDDQVFKARVGAILTNLAQSSWTFRVFAGLGVLGAGIGGGIASTFAKNFTLGLF